MRVQVSWLNTVLGLFGLQIEKIPKKICVFCDGPLPAEPAKVVVNDGSEVEICETCEKILEMSDKVVRGRVTERDEEDGDESLS